MKRVLLRSTQGATIVGAGEAGKKEISKALKLAPFLVAADGGAANALNAGYTPEAVIGDMDSLSEDIRGQLSEGSLHRICEQDSTDFNKCLRSVAAPFFIAVGVMGPRLDHGLAALSSLACNPKKRVFLLTECDVAFLAPRRIEMRLPLGTRVSLFALVEVTGRSKGLRWSIEGIRFAPDGRRTGTSNVAASSVITLEFDNRGMLVILPLEHLDEAVRALEDSGLSTSD